MLRIKALKELESESARKDCTQLFIETPYRNATLWQALLQTLQHNTRLATASGLTLDTAQCHSDLVKNWKHKAWTLSNTVPTVFAIGR